MSDYLSFYQLEQAQDITDFGSLKEAARIFVPGIPSFLVPQVKYFSSFSFSLFGSKVGYFHFIIFSVHQSSYANKTLFCFA